MIALDELESTMNRLEILRNNTESLEEKFLCDQIIPNLKMIADQLEKFMAQPNAKQQIEEIMKNPSK